MKYMLMMNVAGKAPYSISTWARKDVDAHLAFLPAIQPNAQRVW